MLVLVLAAFKAMHRRYRRGAGAIEIGASLGLLHEKSFALHFNPHDYAKPGRHADRRYPSRRRAVAVR